MPSTLLIGLIEERLSDEDCVQRVSDPSGRGPCMVLAGLPGRQGAATGGREGKQRTFTSWRGGDRRPAEKGATDKPWREETREGGVWGVCQGACGKELAHPKGPRGPLVKGHLWGQGWDGGKATNNLGNLMLWTWRSRGVPQTLLPSSGPLQCPLWRLNQWPLAEDVLSRASVVGPP